MISKALEEAINQQMNREMYSSYLYLAMAAFFEDKGLSGFANWMRIQAKEEDFHAMKFFDYLVARDGRVKLLDIEAPPFEWKGPLDVFEYTYTHETKVTGLINNLMKLAVEENDYAAINVLQWYVDEQVEEEESSKAIVDKIKIVGETGPGLYLLDQELAQRVFNPPPAAE